MPDAASAIAVLRYGLLATSAILLAVASLNDIATRTMPDLPSIVLVVIGIAARLADGNAATALAASVGVFLLCGLCWRFGWLGGGDVKLLAACAWLVSPAQVPQLVLLTAIAGGVLACLYLTLNRVMKYASRAQACATRPQSLAARIWHVERWRIRRRAPLPYGCAIAVATLLTLAGG
jgi:prepilin peptidase CpaA